MSLRAIVLIIMLVTYIGIVLPELLIVNSLLRDVTDTLIQKDKSYVNQIYQERNNISSTKLMMLNSLQEDIKNGLQRSKALAISVNESNAQNINLIFNSFNLEISYYNLNNTNETNSSQLNNISIDQLSTTLNWEILIFFVIGIVFLIYVWRISVVIGLSIEIPIRKLSEVISERMKNLEGEDIILSSFEQNFTSETTTKLYKSLIHFLNHIKFQIFGLNDAQTLIQQSTSKQFYQEYGNFRAVGISATNISRIHMKYKRYLEALNEQEESIIIGDQELQSLREYKEFVLDISNKIQFEMNFFKTLQKFKQKLTQKFKKFDDQWVSELFTSKKKVNKFNNFSQITHLSKVKSSQQRSTLLRTTNTKRNFLQNSDNYDLQSINRIQNSIHQNKQVPDTVKEEDDIRLRNPQASFSKRSGDISPINGQIFNDIAQIEDNLDKLNKLEYNRNDEDDPDGILRKLNEIRTEKKIVKEKLLMRKYQYACILFSYSIQKQRVFLMESISILNDIYIETQKVKPLTRSIQTMQINILTKKAFSHNKIGQTEKAQICLQDAQEILLKIQNIQDEFLNEETNYIDIFRNIPIDILKDKIDINLSVYNILNGQIYEAANLLVKILERKGFYDQEQIQFAISTLKNFMGEYDLSLTHIEDLEISLKQKKYEIIILVDYSSKISREQLILSHSIIKYLLDDSSQNNEIGLYAFNEILYESFPLQAKSSYLNLLEETIKQLLVYPGGGTNIFQILEIAACYLFDLKSSTLLRELQSRYQKQKILKETNLPYVEVNQSFIKYQIEIGQTIQTQSLELNVKTSQVQLPSQILDFIHNNVKPKGDEEISFPETLYSYDILPLDFYYQLQIDPGSLKIEEKDRTKQRYIFLFAEGTKDFSEEKLKRLKVILQKKNIDLVVFNISSQNCNMIYLKLLSTLTENSKFLSSQEEITQFSKELRDFKSQKRVYLEFY